MRRGQGTGVGGNQGIGPHHRLDLGEDLAFERQVFRGGFDHPVAGGNVGIVKRADQIRCHCRRIGLAHLALGHRFPRVVLKTQQGAVDGLLRDVDEIEFQTGQRTLEVVADVGSDGAGAYHRDGAGQGAGRSGEQRIGEGCGHGGILLVYAVYKRNYPTLSTITQSA